MKKFRFLTLAIAIVLISVFSITKVNAAGWKTTLNLPYNWAVSGTSRWYGTGMHRINISVDGFNTSAGTLRTYGSTTMQVGLWDVSTGQFLNFNVSSYTYGSCQDRFLGTYNSGYRNYDFFSYVYNESTGGYDVYDGVKSNELYLYPLP